MCDMYKQMEKMSKRILAKVFEGKCALCHDAQGRRLQTNRLQQPEGTFMPQLLLNDVSWF